LVLLHRDVDRVGYDGGTPLDTFNPLRIVRLLAPLGLMAMLGLQTASTFEGGFDQWLAGVHWVPGPNFVGFVDRPTVYAALVGYVLVPLAMQVRGIVGALPEAKDVIQAIPGSFGVAAKMTKEAQQKEALKQAATLKPVRKAKALPVFIVSGPRGTGKSTLIQRLKEADPRFREPDWVVTRDIEQGPGAGSGRRIVVSEGDYKALKKTKSLAVSYRPYGEEGEQVDFGLPAASVIATVKEAGVCLLDVDPPTARQLLEYRWDRPLEALAPGEDVELAFVCVWVSVNSIDTVVERNRAQLQMNGTGAAGGAEADDALEKQLASIRRQATADMEWALTSGRFDFTIVNEDVDAASAELQKDAQYCFDENL